MGNFFETIQTLESGKAGHGRPHYDAVDDLIAELQWAAFCHSAGSEEMLMRHHSDTTTSSSETLVFRKDELEAYRTRHHHMSYSTLQRIGERYVDLQAFFQLPLRLLSTRRVSKHTVLQLMRPYLLRRASFTDAYQWDFPDDMGGTSLNRQLVQSDNYEGLYERGDMFGFMGLVASFRLAHVLKETDEQWLAAHYMIMALPGFCREAFIRPHWQSVLSATRNLLRLLPDCVMPIQPNLRELSFQIFAQDYEPCSARRRLQAREGICLRAPEVPVHSIVCTQCKRDQEPLMLSSLW